MPSTRQRLSLVNSGTSVKKALARPATAQAVVVRREVHLQ
jgi:hypothetical protein